MPGMHSTTVSQVCLDRPSDLTTIEAFKVDSEMPNGVDKSSLHEARQPDRSSADAPRLPTAVSQTYTTSLARRLRLSAEER